MSVVTGEEADIVVMQIASARTSCDRLVIESSAQAVDERAMGSRGRTSDGRRLIAGRGLRGDVICRSRTGRRLRGGFRGSVDPLQRGGDLP